MYIYTDLHYSMNISHCISFVHFSWRLLTRVSKNMTMRDNERQWKRERERERVCVCDS